MDVKAKVREFLGKFIAQNEVEDDDNIFQQGLVNSLFAMQLVNYIENEFDVTVNNDELDIENFKSINAITELISSKL